MAQEIIIRLRDDIDGSDAEQTVEFAYGGGTYEIDLSSANLAEFDEVMARYIQFARRISPKRKPKPKPKAKATPEPSWIEAQQQAGALSVETVSMPGEGGYASDRERTEQLAIVRDWARHNGFTVADRGKISNEVWEAYGDAHDEGQAEG